MSVHPKVSDKWRVLRVVRYIYIYRSHKLSDRERQTDRQRDRDRDRERERQSEIPESRGRREGIVRDTVTVALTAYYTVQSFGSSLRNTYRGFS